MMYLARNDVRQGELIAPNVRIAHPLHGLRGVEVTADTAGDPLTVAEHDGAESPSHFERRMIAEACLLQRAAMMPMPVIDAIEEEDLEGVEGDMPWRRDIAARHIGPNTVVRLDMTDGYHVEGGMICTPPFGYYPSSPYILGPAPGRAVYETMQRASPAANLIIVGGEVVRIVEGTTTTRRQLHRLYRRVRAARLRHWWETGRGPAWANEEVI